MHVPIRTLKAHLSEYLRRAQAGEEIVVTSRGKVVGRLLGPAAERGELASAMERLQAQPWIRPGEGGVLRGATKPARVPRGTADELLRWARGA
jgi:prevent-host-death family protein